MHIWRLKKGSEKKFHSGHPWVFSNELAQSPKGLPAGELVELRDASDGFLAKGYGHPNSLIAFRTLTLAQDGVIDARFFAERFEKASRLRRLSGVDAFSHRLCFAEADGLPGLVIDRYRAALNQGPKQIFVIQASTAGMDRLLSVVVEGLRIFVAGEAASGGATWEESAVVFANDSKSRIMEGLAAEPKNVVKDVAGFSPQATRIKIQPGLSDLAPLGFEVDLVGGQKTGFFLDQRLNVHLASQVASEYFSGAARSGRNEVRILDLCCYVGQWGTQLSHLAKASGLRAEVTLADASLKALEVAARNVESHGGRARIEKMDVLNDLPKLARRGYDIVICDPPAFIKKKKDLPTGTQAYFKLNREAMRRVAPGGIFVSCSCSGLLSEDEFRSMLARVVASHEGETRWLMRGSHSPDHPQRPEFPQGTYLKSWIGIID
jgi:23S rRNA (cytosine1962-C5)-methyltransferase